MNEIFVDISGRYATIDRHDRGHEAAQQFLENDYLRLVTTDYVMDETVTLPQVRLGHSCAVRFLDSLQASRLVQLIYLSQTQDATAQLFRNRPDKGWSFTDCSSFVLMQEYRLKNALAFDDRFRQAGVFTQPRMATTAGLERSVAARRGG